MKIEPELTRAQAQELVDQQRKEYRLIGSQKHIPGLILFEYDLTTGVLSRASAQKEINLNIDGSVGSTTRVDAKDLCLYVQAINEANALRKIRLKLRQKNVREKLFKPKSNGK